MCHDRLLCKVQVCLFVCPRARCATKLSLNWSHQNKGKYICRLEIQLFLYKGFIREIDNKTELFKPPGYIIITLCRTTSENRSSRSNRKEQIQKT